MGRRFWQSAVLAAGIGLAAPGGHAGTAAEQLFALGVLAPVATGSTLSYAHERSGSADPEKLGALKDARIDLAIRLGADGARAATLTRHQGPGRRELGPFPADGGNPVLVAFLESAVTRMASLSGGSPFYIRNRIKDAFRAGGTALPVTAEFGGKPLAATEITIAPFAADPHRDQMQGFGGLTLVFVLADDAPGHFLRLTASTPADSAGAVLFHETLALAGLRTEN